MQKVDTILLDMDGVIADYVNAVFVACGREPIKARNWPKGVYDLSAVMKISQVEINKRTNYKDFWLNIPAYNTAPMLYSYLTSFTVDIIFASAGGDSIHCLGEKLQWAQTFAGNKYIDYMFGPSKYLMAHSNVLLIDDNDRQVENFKRAGGQAILYPRPWNRRHKEYDYLNPFETAYRVIDEVRLFCHAEKGTPEN